MKVIILLLTLLFVVPAFLQEHKKDKDKPRNRWQERYSGGKGTFFLRYGWNRSIYTRSDLSFWGPGYSFTVKDAIAKDFPEKFSFKVYFSPKTWSIPQFSTQIGYYFDDHWAVAIGWDHMKYIFQPGTYLFSGVIEPEASADWVGVFDDTPITTTPELLHYENTDGLNYTRIEIIRADQWWREKKGIVAINTLFGLSTGMMITRNDFSFAGKWQQNNFAVSGWGLSAHVGIRIDFINLLFFQYNVAGGLVHLPKVNTRTGEPEYARQVFMYGGTDFAFGALWYIRKINRVPEKHIR